MMGRPGSDECEEALSKLLSVFYQLGFPVAESKLEGPTTCIIMACALWGSLWRNGTVTVHCDNTAAVAVVNSGYSRVPDIMHLLRCMFFIRARFQVDVWAVHTPRVDNRVADAISRNDLHHSFSQVPGARPQGTVIPPSLQALLIEEQPDWTSPTWTQLFGSCFGQD